MKGKAKVRMRPIWIAGIYISILLLNGCRQTYAQHLTLNLTSINSADHLSQNTILSIYQDRYGFMWFGTQDGLNKYDGYRIEVFKNRRDDPNSISANHITAISEDAQGNLWVGTRTGGLNKFDRTKNTFSRFQTHDKDPRYTNSDQINVIFKDSQSNMWVGTPAGLNLLTRTSKSFKNIPLEPRDGAGGREGVRSIFEDSKKNIWIGTTKGLKLLGKDFQVAFTFQVPKTRGNKVNAISEDDGGNIWLGTESGLKLLNRSKGTFVDFAIDQDLNSVGGQNPIFCLLKGEYNTFWLATNTTLQLFDAKSRKVVQIGEKTDGDSQMPDDAIYSLFRDKASTMWIGTSSQGVLKLDRNLTIFQSYKASHTIIPSAKNIIRGLAEDNRGNLYLATDAGLEYFDRANLSTKIYTHQRGKPNSLSSNYTTAVIYSMKSGLVWIGTYSNGLDVFNPRTGTFKHYTTGTNDRTINSNSIDALLEDRFGRIWVATDAGGVSVFDPVTGKFTQYLHDASKADRTLADNTALALFEDKKGNIWIGGYSKGVSILDPVTHSFSQLNTSNSELTSDVISCFHEDAKGNMWIGTLGGGLNLYSPRGSALTSFTEGSGLISNSVNYISEDAAGKLWVSTNRGIVSLDPDKKVFRNFGRSNNLKTMEFNVGAGAKLSSGEIVMGSINGFNIIDPSRVTLNANKPGVVFTELLLFNKPIGLNIKKGPLKQTLLTTNELTLDYAHSVFTISFTALDYASPEDNQYAYFLEGFDQDWNHTGNMHSASYTNLNPGTYTLKVRAANNDGIWNDKEALLIIHIKSPYWMTWWFKAGVGLLIAAAAFWFYKYRLNFVRRQTTKLELLVRERTTEIGDQAASLRKLNQHLLENALSLGQLNTQLEQQKAQERKARLSAEYSQKQADMANSAKSTFLATMSHELRTPINGVIGMASLLTETTLNDEQREYTDAILTSGQSLLGVINDVLDFSKIESGNIELEAHHFELRKCLEDVLELFGAKIVESGIELLYLIEDDVPAFLEADGLRLSQVLTNLVANAVKFTHEGEVFVRVALSGSFESNQTLRFTIADTGIGISKDQQQNLFKAFNQLDSSVTRKYGGSGLGLVICERLVKLMGGHIEVDSEFGKGTTFSFEITCQRGESPHAASNEPEIPFPADQSVLVVNANKNSQEILKRYFHSFKIKSIMVDSMAQALEVLAGNRKVNLVIADLNLPDAEGLQLGKQIRESASGIQVILLGSLKNEYQRNFQPYFNTILNKPVRRAHLLKAVSEALKVERSLKAEKKKAILSEEFASNYPYEILIAEDILMNQKLIIWILNKLGYKPDLANNGVEVLEMMKEKVYDVILMDLQMPKMDGLEATRIIRKTLGARPFIIALTANAMSEDKENCFRAGMDDYIPKPIDLELLTKSLMNLHNSPINV